MFMSTSETKTLLIFFDIKCSRFAKFSATSSYHTHIFCSFCWQPIINIKYYIDLLLDIDWPDEKLERIEFNSGLHEFLSSVLSNILLFESWMLPFCVL